MLFKKNGVVELSNKTLDEASSVLALAFEHDPMVNYVLTQQTHEQRCAFFIHMCEVRYDLEWPILGYYHNSKLVGVVLASEPEVKNWPSSLMRSYMRLGDEIGPDAVKRLEAYTQLASRHRLKEPHYYIGVVGVIPEYRGRGYGTHLMEAVQTRSRQHPTSTGVMLETENPVNLPYYQHIGYHIIAEDKLGPNSIWSMFRPN